MKKLSLFFCLLSLITQWIAAQQIIYVRDGGAPSGNGQSWTTAYPRLQDALNTAQAGDEIRVAAGMYKPTEDADREKSFMFKSEVRLRGGFAGTGLNPDEHTPSQHETILSGDIGIPNDHSDNSYTILTSSGSLEEGTLLEGFIIEHGTANSTDPAHLVLHPKRAGAGIYLDKGTVCDLTIRHCVFRNNEATGHGGHACFYQINALSNLSIEHCTFKEGSGLSAFYFRGNATKPLRMVYCNFIGNITNSIGLIERFNQISSVEIISSKFENNSLADAIGITIHRVDTIFIHDCLFRANSIGNGALMDPRYESYASIIRDTFIDNIGNFNAITNGIINLSAGFPSPLTPYTDINFTLAKCLFEGNEMGSLIRGVESGAIEQCTIKNNKIKYLFSDFNVTKNGKELSLDNCLFEENESHALLFLESYNGGSGVKVSSTWNFNQNLFRKNKGLLFDSRYHNVLNDTTKLRWNFCTFTENQRWVDTTDSSLRCLFYLKGVDSVAFNSCVVDQQLEADETLFFDSLSHIRLDNCLLRADSCSQIYTYGGNNVICGSENQWALESFFENPQSGDYRLEACSPGINKGDETKRVQLGLESDFAGQPRRANLLPDVGAFERVLTLLPAISWYNCGHPAEASVSFQGDGCEPFSVSWSNGQQAGTATENLPAGQYGFTTTDAHGIQYIANLSVPAYSQVFIDTLLIHPSNMSATNGAIAVLVTGGGVPTFQYKWSNGANGSAVSGLGAGYYKLTITDQLGCEFVFEFDLTATVASTESPGVVSPLAVWPNPAKDQIHVVLPIPRTETGFREIEICNAVGRVVLNLWVPSHWDKLTLSVQTYPSGIYFLILKEDGEPTHVGKVIKY